MSQQSVPYRLREGLIYGITFVQDEKDERMNDTLMTSTSDFKKIKPFVLWAIKSNVPLMGNWVLHSNDKHT